ncbi:MAG: tRNA (adenosine(37)-N6)-dimethylallyltransferase MiaA [Candidatus Dormibacteria bacterium]
MSGPPVVQGASRSRPQVVAVMGPTASGKTQLAVALAQRLGAELVNADSRQAVQELSVGVGKPTSAELQGIFCHGLDWSHLGEPFSAAEYRARASGCIEEVAGRGHPAVVVGGTGLYVRSLLAGFDFGGVPPDRAWRLAAGGGEESEHPTAAALGRAHPEWGARVDLGNPRRVIRQAELSRAGARAGHRPPPWSVTKLGCRVGPEQLRTRIEARSDQLMDAALRGEVESLLDRGFPAEVLARAGIGYAEALAWLQGRCERSAAVTRVVARTWRYARAQMTWLRSEPDLVWVDAEAGPTAAVEQCLIAIGDVEASRER